MVVKGKRPYHSERRTAAADETRTRILAAARSLMAGGGERPFSLDSVAKEAGVTRLTVYNQFESKQGLLEAVFDDMARVSRLMEEVPAVFTLADPRAALQRFVSIMCRFWGFHREAMPRFDALTRLDEDVAASLKARRERRRTVLNTLVGRLQGGRADPELVDLLYALTGFEMFESLSVNGRRPEAVEAMMQAMVEAALERYGAGPDKKKA
ncbi:MAG TPA: TetR/AcrR family transcriptional regulator [Gammaproteobacteria bacterium]|nr:TetR/AcrR family transcriptional regulator [Gammaproteobacteria bacterium]